MTWILAFLSLVVGLGCWWVSVVVVPEIVHKVLRIAMQVVLMIVGAFFVSYGVGMLLLLSGHHGLN